MSEKPNRFGVFQNRAFRQLYFAMFTSQLGSTVGMTAFFYYLLESYADKPFYATLTELTFSLPTLLVFFIVGVLADRLDRQKIAVHADLIQAGLTVLFLGAVWIKWMPLVFFLLFLRSAVGKFFDPAQSALVRGVLSKEEQTSAVGINQMTGSLFLLFGSGLGAACYWTLGVYGAILIDAMSFLLSSLLIRRGKMPEEARLPNGPSSWRDLNVRAVWQDLRAGSVYIIRHRLLLSLMLGLLMFGLLNGTLAVAPAFMLRYKLSPDDYQQVNVVMAIVFGSGMLIGSPLASRWVKRMKMHTMIIASCFAFGVLLEVLGTVENKTVFVALYGLGGLLLPFINIPFFGWRNQIVDPKMMGRVMGWHSPLLMISHSAMLGFISIVFPRFVPVESLFYMIGGVVLLLSLYYLLVLPRFAAKDESMSASAF